MRDAGHIVKTADALNYPLANKWGGGSHFSSTVHAAREKGCAMTNHFPLPWCVEERDRCFVVRDDNGQVVSNVYFEDEPKRHLFTRDEARHLARNVATLPELLRRG